MCLLVLAILYLNPSKYWFLLFLVLYILYVQKETFAVAKLIVTYLFNQEIIIVLITEHI
jgi:hypothetical protein